MISLSGLKNWITAPFRSTAISEFGQIAQETAKSLGAADCIKLRGDRVLIVTPPFGLLLEEAENRSIQAYCCICNDLDWGVEAVREFGFHQADQPFQERSWIWFPRLDANGATSYNRGELRRSQKTIEWSIGRVRPALETHREAPTRAAMAHAMGQQISSDFVLLRTKLSEAMHPR